MSVFIGFIGAIVGALLNTVWLEHQHKNKTYEMLLKSLFVLRLDYITKQRTLKTLNKRINELSKGYAFAKMYASDEVNRLFKKVQDLVISGKDAQFEIENLEALVKKEIKPWYKQVHIWGWLGIVLLIMFFVSNIFVISNNCKEPQQNDIKQIVSSINTLSKTHTSQQQTVEITKGNISITTSSYPKD